MDKQQTQQQQQLIKEYQQIEKVFSQTLEQKESSMIEFIQYPDNIAYQLEAYLNHLKNNKDLKLILCLQNVQKMEEYEQYFKIKQQHAQKQSQQLQIFNICSLASQKYICLNQKCACRKKNLLETDKLISKVKKINQEQILNNIKIQTIKQIQQNSLSIQQENLRKQQQQQNPEKAYVCPYIMSVCIAQLPQFQLILTTHQQLLDQQFQDIFQNFEKEKCSVVFDESLKIDEISSNLYSRDYNRKLLNSAFQAVLKLEDRIQEFQTNSQNFSKREQSEQKFIIQKKPHFELTDIQKKLENIYVNLKEQKTLKEQEKDEMEKNTDIIEQEGEQEKEKQLDKLDQEIMILEKSMKEADLNLQKNHYVPGNIRQPKYCIQFLKVYIHALMNILTQFHTNKDKMNKLLLIQQQQQQQSQYSNNNGTNNDLNKNQLKIKQFVEKLQAGGQGQASIDMRTLRFLRYRVFFLLQLLEIEDYNEFSNLINVIEFGSILSFENLDDYEIIYEQQSEFMSEKSKNLPNILQNPQFKLQLLNCGKIFQKIYQQYRCIIFLSRSFPSNVSLKEIYVKMLGFENQPGKNYLALKQIDQYRLQSPSNCLNCPMVITKSGDQAIYRSNRGNDKERAKNYGNLLLDLTKIVSDGITVFFPSFGLMEQILKVWKDSEGDDQSILQNLKQNTVLFTESRCPKESIKNLENFKKVCNSGRGAIFFASQSGKISQYQTFRDHYSRSIVIFGRKDQFQHQNEDRRNYVEKNYGIKNFARFDIMRNISQSVFSSLVSRYDYAGLLFVDEEFAKIKLNDYLSRLFKTNDEQIKRYTDISSGQAVSEIKTLFREIDYLVPDQQQ